MLTVILIAFAALWLVPAAVGLWSDHLDRIDASRRTDAPAPTPMECVQAAVKRGHWL